MITGWDVENQDASAVGAVVDAGENNEWFVQMEERRLRGESRSVLLMPERLPESRGIMPEAPRCHESLLKSSASQPGLDFSLIATDVMSPVMVSHKSVTEDLRSLICGAEYKPLS